MVHKDDDDKPIRSGHIQAQGNNILRRLGRQSGCTINEGLHQEKPLPLSGRRAKMSKYFIV